jgi:aspartate carbamoyltransferase catalytic subunit
LLHHPQASTKAKKLLANARRLADKGSYDIIKKMIVIDEKLQERNSLFPLTQEDIEITLEKEIGKLDDLKIALIGDLKYGRTVHSLSNALTLFNNIKIYLVSPKELKMPQEILHDLNKTNVEYEEVENIEKVIDDVDVLYVTRIQKERFIDVDDYLKIKGAYIINKKMLEGKDLIVMHPLPRIDEIDTNVDNTKYNKYFAQAANAVPVRMAILKTLIKNNPK